MWTAALAFIRPFWKQIAWVLVAFVVIAWARGWYERKIEESYQRGVAVTEAKDAAILAERERENFLIVTALKVSAAEEKAKLEGRIHEAKIVADNLRAQLRARRVCSDERSGRSVPENPAAPSEGDGTAGDAGSAQPVEASPFATVGDDVVAIVEQCQLNTDKLISLQSYVGTLMLQLNRMSEESRGR